MQLLESMRDTCTVLKGLKLGNQMNWSIKQQDYTSNKFYFIFSSFLFAIDAYQNKNKKQIKANTNQNTEMYLVHSFQMLRFLRITNNTCMVNKRNWYQSISSTYQSLQSLEGPPAPIKLCVS